MIKIKMQSELSGKIDRHMDNSEVEELFSELKPPG
jgi:hypothetical protein